MGSGIAQIAATAGHAVLLFDTRTEALDKAMAGLKKILDRQVEKGRMTADETAGILGRITPISGLKEMSGCGLVLEAIIETSKSKGLFLRNWNPLLLQMPFWPATPPLCPLPRSVALANNRIVFLDCISSILHP